MRLRALPVASLALTATSAFAQASDHPAGTIVASNMNDNTATVLDAATGRLLATLPTGEGPHEVAISHDGRWATVSNYGVRGKPGSTITVIDVVRRAVDRTIDLHEYQRPHGMAFFPGDSLLAVTSEAGKAVLIVDFRSGTVRRTLPTNARTSHMVAMSANGARLATANIADGTVALLDPSSPDASTLVRVAAQPEGIAITPSGSTVWVGSNRDSVVLVIDVARAAVVDTLRGFGLPYRLAISPDEKLAVITDPAKAEVRVVDAQSHRGRFTISIARDSLVSTAEIPGSPSPEGVTISPDSRWAFVTLQGRNRVATIDLDRGVIVAMAPTGVWSDGVGFSTRQGLIHGAR
jgi:DNA-binding beta-propeller fold protein YncE